MEYEKYEKLICKQAWNFSRRTGVDFKEALAIANLAFVEAAKTYDSEKAKFSTWLCQNINFAFLTSYKTVRENRKIVSEGENHNIILGGKIEQHKGRLINELSSLSKAAQEVAACVLSEKITTYTKGNITEYFRSLGWDWKIIRSAFSEISEMLNEI